MKSVFNEVVERSAYSFTIEELSKEVHARWQWDGGYRIATTRDLTNADLILLLLEKLESKPNV